MLMLKDEEVVAEVSTTLNQPAENTSRKIFIFSNTNTVRAEKDRQNQNMTKEPNETQQSEAVM